KLRIRKNKKPAIILKQKHSLRVYRQLIVARLVHKQQIQQANQGSWGKNKVCKSVRKRHPKSVAQIRSKRSTISPLSIAFCTGLEIHCPPNPARAVKYSLGTPSLSLSTFSMNSKGNSDGFTS